mmetsp:Transcript_19819/g.14573  ORF Transcript_19819/g.14573 Transcript_19819/m.14573 type:complete len:82 (-) Transcript_19819:44-289(-)
MPPGGDFFGFSAGSSDNNAGLGDSGFGGGHVNAPSHNEPIIQDEYGKQGIIDMFGDFSVSQSMANMNINDATSDMFSQQNP